MTSKSPSTRDKGLRQVSTVTKYLAAAAAALTGFFAVWEARSVHDASATTPTAPVTRSGNDGAGAVNPSPSDGSYSNDDLQAPDYAPAPSYQPPAASSGGS